MDCSKCSKELIYEPYYCISCDKPICLFCLQTADITICKGCYEEQNNIPDLKKGKCSHLDHQMFGDKTKKIFDVYKCSCGMDMDMCEDHSKKCKSCRVKVCSNCGDYCIKDGTLCRKCNKRVSKYTSSTCIICGFVRCNYCFMGIRIFGFIICNAHLISCIDKLHCGFSNIYKIKSYGCNFKGCFDYPCSNLCFKKIKEVKSMDDIIKVCHKHAGLCKVCNKNYPLTNIGTIKYKNSKNKIHCCSHCFESIRVFIDSILISYKKNGIKEIIDVIIKILFSQ